MQGRSCSHKQETADRNIFLSADFYLSVFLSFGFLYMGCNDLTSAEYISKKCGKITISQTSSQRPQLPLFASVYANTRYSQTRSNTHREMMKTKKSRQGDNPDGTSKD